MDSVRILKTEMSVTNIDDVAKNLVFKNKIEDEQVKDSSMGDCTIQSLKLVQNMKQPIF